MRHVRQVLVLKLMDMVELMRKGVMDCYPLHRVHLDRHRREGELLRVVEVEIGKLDIDLQVPPLDYTLNVVLSFPVLLSPFES